MNANLGIFKEVLVFTIDFYLGFQIRWKFGLLAYMKASNNKTFPGLGTFLQKPPE
jgi:hypothetical protein